MVVDYFTKWVEARPVRQATQKDNIQFVEESILHHFGVPETITTDQGMMFTGETFVRFLEARQIKMLNSSPYYTQANGQEEAVNKIIINLMRRNVGKHPRRWHEKLSEVLWACRTNIKTATGVTPFGLVYGHEAVLPAEIMVPALRAKR